MSHAYTLVPLTPLRKAIATRMTLAKQTIPHYRVAADITVDALLTLRREINAAHPDGKVSVNDLIVKACAAALMEVPALNIQFVEGDIHQYHRADISVVMSVKGGLVTPVVRAANEKSVRQIAVEVKAFTARAAAGQLKMNEITGGTFSVSNLGMFDIDAFDAIINPPQGAILAVGSARPQAVVKNRKVGIAHVMRVSLSLDHRVIDGAEGAVFLSALKTLIEAPEPFSI